MALFLLFVHIKINTHTALIFNVVRFIQLKIPNRTYYLHNNIIILLYVAKTAYE